MHSRSVRGTLGNVVLVGKLCVDFYEDLAKELIWNDLPGAVPRTEPRKVGHGVSRQEWADGVAATSRGRPSRKRAPADGASANVEQQVCQHEIYPLKKLDAYKDCKDARLNCRVCKKYGATLFCKSCSRNEHGQVLALCSPWTSCSCLSLHCATPV